MVVLNVLWDPNITNRCNSIDVMAQFVRIFYLHMTPMITDNGPQ